MADGGMRADALLAMRSGSQTRTMVACSDLLAFRLNVPVSTGGSANAHSQMPRRTPACGMPPGGAPG